MVPQYLFFLNWYKINHLAFRHDILICLQDRCWACVLASSEIFEDGVCSSNQQSPDCHRQHWLVSSFPHDVPFIEWFDSLQKLAYYGRYKNSTNCKSTEDCNDVVQSKNYWNYKIETQFTLKICSELKITVFTLRQFLSTYFVSQKYKVLKVVVDYQ